METIAFYSYKGGVGRSLTLAECTLFLASHGKNVVALDFDFEAPGLHYKFAADLAVPSRGVVSYLAATANGSTNAPPLTEHMVSAPSPGAWIRLMPAGPAPERRYWKQLKELGDKLRVFDPSGRGLMTVLDLQARIADELKPDYLLIDARTGITDFGSVATMTLADTVVCLFAANQESLDGTRVVIDALKSAQRLSGQKPIRVVPVVSRMRPTFHDQALARKAMLEFGEQIFELPHSPDVADQLGPGLELRDRYNLLFSALFPAIPTETAEPAKTP